MEETKKEEFTRVQRTNGEYFKIDKQRKIVVVSE